MRTEASNRREFDWKTLGILKDCSDRKKEEFSS
jgi:hypothetical protein